MKPKVAGALLSGLVFPGVGQMYLRRRARGWVFLLLSLLAACYYASHALEQASALTDQILSGTVPLDPAAVEARLESAPTPLAVSVAGFGFVACWVGSVLEALLT